MHIMNLEEFEQRVSDLQQQLKGHPDHGHIVRLLDDVHSLWGSRMENWVNDPDVVAAYNSLRGQRDSLDRGEDVMERIRETVDRLLATIRVALKRLREA